MPDASAGPSPIVRYLTAAHYACRRQSRARNSPSPGSCHRSGSGSGSGYSAAQRCRSASTSTAPPRRCARASTRRRNPRRSARRGTRHPPRSTRPAQEYDAARSCIPRRTRAMAANAHGRVHGHDEDRACARMFAADGRRSVGVFVARMSEMQLAPALVSSADLRGRVDENGSGWVCWG
jgi:hypothetical protein